MARDVVDELSIKINASASSAIQNISKLQTALKGLSNTVGDLSGKKIDFSGFTGGKGSGSSGSINARLSALGQAGSQAMRGLSNVTKASGKVIANATKKILSNFGLINKSARSMFTVADGIKSVMGGILGFRGLSSAFGWIKDSIQLGADITEIDHIVESVFGDMSSAVDNFAKRSIADFGIASASAKKYSGFLSSMFQATGLDYKTAGEMGINLTALAGDLSAFYNIGTEEAFEKIRAGMSGMVRPLRAIGIDLTAATLSEYALAQGIQKSYSEMTQAEKVMLRYNYLMDNTRTQQGDFQRTAESMANASRTLAANMSALKTNIGEGFVAAIRPMIVGLNVLMQALIKAAKAFAIFMQTITGGKYKGMASGIAMDMGDADMYMDDLADSADAASSGLGGAAGSAKKLKKELSVLPFDELNQLNKDSSSSGSGGGGGGAGGGGGSDLLDFDLADAYYDLEDLLGNDVADAISKWGQRIRNAFDARDWQELGESIAWGFNIGLQKLYDVLDPKEIHAKIGTFLNAITATFNSFVRSFDWGMLGRVVGRGVNNLVDILYRTINGIDWIGLGRQLAAGANGLVAEINFSRVGELIGAKFMVVWKILWGFATDFNWGRLGSQLGRGVNAINRKVDFSRVAEAIAKSFNGIFETLDKFTRRVNWGAIAQNITDGLNKFFRTFNWAGNGAKLNNFIQNMLDTLVSIAKGTDWSRFGRGIATALQKIQWGEILKKAFVSLKEIIGGIWSGLGDTAAGQFLRAIVLFKVGTKLMPFINNITKAISGDTLTGLLKRPLTNALNNALGGSASMASKSIGTLLAPWFAGIAAAFGGFLVLLYAQIKGNEHYFRDSLDLVKEVETAHENLQKSIESSKTAIDDNAAEYAANRAAVEPYIERLKELEGQSELTASEQAEMQRIVKLLNDTYPGLNAEIDESTGLLKQTSDEILNYIGNLEKQAKAEVYFEELKQGYKDLYNAQKVQSDVQERYNSGQERINELKRRQAALQRAEINATKDLNKQLENGTITQDEYNQKRQELNDANAAGAGEAQRLADEIHRVEDNLDKLSPELEQANTDVETAQGVVDDYTEAYKELSGQTENYGGTLADQMEILMDVGGTYEALSAKLEELHTQGLITDDQFSDLTGTMLYFKDGGYEAEEAIIAVKDQLATLDSVHQKQVQDAHKAYSEFVADTKSSLAQAADGWKDFQTKADGSTETLHEALTRQTEELNNWTSNMQKLMAAGVDEGFIAELNRMGPAGAAQVQAAIDQIERDGGVATLNADWQALIDAKNLGNDIGKDFEESAQKSFANAYGVLESEVATGSVEVTKAVVSGLTSNDGMRELVPMYQAMAKRGILDPLSNTLQTGSPSKKTQQIGQWAIQGLVNGANSNLGTLSATMTSVVNTMLAPFKNIGTQFGAVGNQIATSLANAVKSAGTSLAQAGSGVVVTFMNGLKGQFASTFTTFSNSLATTIGSAFNFNLYSHGQAAASSFIRGIQSMKVPVPHISRKANNMGITVGGQRIEVPQFEVKWYKKGGLFTGGSGQIIGVAEGNRDEAVLPLENTRAMSRIADAIVSNANGSGLGIDSRAIADAVARGVSVAIAANAGNDDPMVIEVKVDSEVIARAATKGQKKIDRRYNPVAKMA